MSPVVVGFVLLTGILLVLLASAQRFRRHEEWLILYRLGKTSKENIRGPWTQASPFQGVFGDYVVVLRLPFIDRGVRVQGELMEAWMDVREALPFGVAVSRPTRDAANGVWVVRARGWDPEARGSQQLDVEASGLTEATAVHELATRLGAT
jgi:hypothetical protein